MRAIVLDGEELRLEKRADPVPGSSEVLVSARYAALNPAEGAAADAGLFPCVPSSQTADTVTRTAKVTITEVICATRRRKTGKLRARGRASSGRSSRMRSKVLPQPPSSETEEISVPSGGSTRPFRRTRAR